MTPVVLIQFQVADELVADFIAQANEGEVTGEHKNIRRRVYDALNVLMAMRVCFTFSAVALFSNSRCR